MAMRYTDDLDGTDNASRFVIALKSEPTGTLVYEIDLGEENSRALQKALEPFLRFARLCTGFKLVPATQESPDREADVEDAVWCEDASDNDTPPIPPMEARTWARTHGLDLVPEGGRLAVEVRLAYADFLQGKTGRWERLKENPRFSKAAREKAQRAAKITREALAEIAAS